MRLAPADASQSELILSLFAGSPTYYERVEGGSPTLASVAEALNNRPKQTVPEYKAEFLIVYDDEDRPIGTVELHLNHRAKGVAYIGLLQILEELHGTGVGRRAYAAVEERVRELHKCHRIQLGVADNNDVSGFWSKLGFKTNGHTYAYMGGRHSNHVVEYEKAL